MEKEIKGMEHLDYLDKYYQDITEYLESGKTINFNRKGHDYILVRFFEKEMKFEARRKEDDKMGKLPVTSYEVEDIYNKLFKNQKNQNEENSMKKTKPTKKMQEKEEVQKQEEVVTEKKKENVEKKLPASKFIIEKSEKIKSIEKMAKIVEENGYTLSLPYDKYVMNVNKKYSLGLS